MEKSAEWEKKAAEHGMPYNLSVKYNRGDGVEQNEVRNVELCKQAENGGRDACACLAALSVHYGFEGGDEVNADLAREYANKAIAADTGTDPEDESPYRGIGLAKSVLNDLG